MNIVMFHKFFRFLYISEQRRESCCFISIEHFSFCFHRNMLNKS